MTSFNKVTPKGSNINLPYFNEILNKMTSYNNVTSEGFHISPSYFHGMRM